MPSDTDTVVTDHLAGQVDWEEVGSFIEEHASQLGERAATSTEAEGKTYTVWLKKEEAEELMGLGTGRITLGVRRLLAERRARAADPSP